MRLKKFLRWLENNRPLITTKKKQDVFVLKCMHLVDKVNGRHARAAVRPVIHDLEKLRANTWDQDKITHIQNWLKDNFEIE